MATVAASAPTTYTVVDAVPLPISQRFPVPISATAGCRDIDTGWSIIGTTSPYIVGSAVNPESGYLDPVIGQIWPR